MTDLLDPWHDPATMAHLTALLPESLHPTLVEMAEQMYLHLVEDADAVAVLGLPRLAELVVGRSIASRCTAGAAASICRKASPGAWACATWKSRSATTGATSGSWRANTISPRCASTRFSPRIAAPNSSAGRAGWVSATEPRFRPQSAPPHTNPCRRLPKLNWTQLCTVHAPFAGVVFPPESAFPSPGAGKKAKRFF